MSPERRGSGGGTLQQNGFLETCRNYLRAELFGIYDESQLEHLRGLGTDVRIIDYRVDPETLSLLHNGILPMPTKHKLPEEVWYFKACFRADPSMEIKIFIGVFNGGPPAEPLGMHNGQKWIYYPQSIHPNRRMDNTEPKR